MTGEVATEEQFAPEILSKKRKRNAGPRKPKEKPVECPVCLTGRAPSLMVDGLPCNCTYCRPCIREIFAISLQSENGISNSPARCCGKVLDHVLLESHLTPQMRKAYRSKMEEIASNEPLYCGNPDCGAFILEAYIKDDFGSCGKCKMKTCVKKECNKTRAEHLGVHVICPGQLETAELRMLAEEKGWKRCPKCYVLTERVRGCNDIRCYCRTEWCYQCGKALKGTKDVCLCYPPRVPPPAPPTQHRVQIPEGVIDLRDEDGHDTNMNDVKPSIEDIQRDSASIFYTESDLMAALDRSASFPTQARSHNPIAQLETTASQVEPDVIQELDALAEPNTREVQSPLQRTSDVHAGSVDRYTSAFTREPTFDDYLDSLEDMLFAFDSYEASSSTGLITDPDNHETNPEPTVSNPFPYSNTESEPESNSLSNAPLAHPGETSNSVQEAIQAEEDTSTELNANQLMHSIEEYLGTEDIQNTDEPREAE